MLEQQAEARDFDPAPLFPDAGPEELLRQVSAVREWLKGLPLGRRPLVQVCVEQALDCILALLYTTSRTRSRFHSYTRQCDRLQAAESFRGCEHARGHVSTADNKP